MTRSISTTIDGEEYSAQYSVENGMVTLESDYGYKTARSGPAPQAIAYLMLNEVVRAYFARERLREDASEKRKDS